MLWIGPELLLFEMISSELILSEYSAIVRAYWAGNNDTGLVASERGREFNASHELNTPLPECAAHLERCMRIGDMEAKQRDLCAPHATAMGGHRTIPPPHCHHTLHPKSATYRRPLFLVHISDHC